MSKMGWHCSDTAMINFEDVRVPHTNLIGEENRGFRGIMANFNNERLMLAQNWVSMAQVCYEEALDWPKNRVAFGSTLSNFQVLRHKLVDMRMEIEAAQAYIDRLCLDQMALCEAGDTSSPAYRAHVASVSMAKNFASIVMERVASDSLQILGGAGYMKGTQCERIFRETKVMQIG